MSDAEEAAICPDETLTALVAELQQDEAGGTAQLDRLVERYHQDARLHFLKASMMAGRREYAGARKGMRRALDLMPDFQIARFQLGFLLLTEGEPWAAQEAWGPLHGLPEGHYLLHFVRGLNHLIRDEFVDVIAELERGVAANHENPPLNGDMRLVIEEVQRKRLTGEDGGPGEMSSAQLLLQQAALRSTRH